jgi:uncharacterized membrane protein YeaQ/YmgE (transglycosylase-associated protein family)
LLRALLSVKLDPEMSNSMGAAGGAGTGSPALGDLSIRHCVATVSRLVVFFEPRPEPIGPIASYTVAKAGGAFPAYAVSSSESDRQSGLTVLRNPIPDVAVGDWLQVKVPRPPGPPLIHFVRVDSELAVRSNEWFSALVQPNGASPTDADLPQRSRIATRLPEPALLIVVAGLIALVTLGVVAMFLASTGDMGSIATAAFGVIGSVVGAFFGVHAGLGDRKRLDRERQLEATKGQMLAAMMPEANKKDALDMLKQYGPWDRKQDVKRFREGESGALLVLERVGCVTSGHAA